MVGSFWGIEPGIDELNGIVAAPSTCEHGHKPEAVMRVEKASVRETERVVRSRSRIPTCASSRATARLMPGWETFKDRAAAAKPPDLTAAARALTPFRMRSSKLMTLC
jgi:hypothetical protein